MSIISKPFQHWHWGNVYKKPEKSPGNFVTGIPLIKDFSAQLNLTYVRSNFSSNPLFISSNFFVSLWYTFYSHFVILKTRTCTYPHRLCTKYSTHIYYTNISHPWDSYSCINNEHAFAHIRTLTRTYVNTYMFASMQGCNTYNSGHTHTDK